MKRRTWAHTNNALLGLLVVVLPFLGLPESIKTILFVIFGLLIILFSLAGGVNQPDHNATPPQA